MNAVAETSALYYWTGVGSRRTDRSRAPVMTRFAQAMALQGAFMRSGAAPGPDTWFEDGTPVHQKRIYVPDDEFRQWAKRRREEVVIPKEVDLLLWLRACSIAEELHPLGRRMSADVRGLMGRNVFQVLGDDLKTPSKFLVCDAPLPVFDAEGRVVDVDGGTGMAVRLAARYQVPVFHMSIPAHLQRIEAFANAKLGPAPTSSLRYP